MGIEKQSSKGGGGYVGGFLQLFDWNSKSRRKLLSNKPYLPEGSKQGKQSDGSFPMTRVHLIERDENGGSSIKGSSDYSSASSVTDDEGYETRAPGVVARLMGLDSLPRSNVAEPYSIPFSDSHYLGDAHYHRRTRECHNEHQIMHSSNQPNKFQSFSRIPAESRPQKMQNRAIERFQTETLPPKSAKSIPITQHKILSPIKSHGFIPTKNAVHIMEAAAKIIEPGPQATTKRKIPSIGSTSIPLKVRDFKEKMEAVQRTPKLPESSRRPVESNTINYLKGQSRSKSCNGSEDTLQFRASPDSEESNSVGLKNKGKSISLAIQAKVNVQRREGLNSSSSQSLLGQREHTDVKSNQPLKNQPSTHKNTQKKISMHSASGVLRQNNQKQNCLTNKDKLPSKRLISNQQGRKPLSGDAYFGQKSTLNKAAGKSKNGSRKAGLEATNIEKEVPSSRTKNVPRKKRSIEGGFHSEKNGIVDTVLVDEDKKPILSNVGRDRHLMQAEDSRRKGMDVVSFTFTSPMMKAISVSQSSGVVVKKKNNLCMDLCGENILFEEKNTKLSSLGLNVIGGDVLSVLLEQKLRELTYGAESSFCNPVKAGTIASSASVLHDLMSSLNEVSPKPREHDKGSQYGLCNDKFGCICDPACSSTDADFLKMNHLLQGDERMGECISSNNEARKELDCQHPSPVSVLEPSFSNESSNSSDSRDSESSNSSKHCLSVQAQEVVGLNCPWKFQSVEAETELSDSAFFTSTHMEGRKHVTTFNVADSTQSNKWELEYVREILCNAEIMFNDFALGQAREIINPHLFDQLETQKTKLTSEGETDSAIRRKMLFDCVSECLNLRCRKYVGAGHRTWAKGVAMVQRKGWLAEEVYKEISGWRSMGDWMVDELVDKDMSTQHGRWLEFEIEAFEVGVEIVERGILRSLVDEVVADIMLV